MNKNLLLSQLKLEEKFIECIYIFGSQAYGTASEQRQSGYDIVIVLKSSTSIIHPLLKWKNVNWLTKHNWINPDFRDQFSDASDKVCFTDLGDRVAQVWIFNTFTFLMLLQTNTIFAIECIYLPEELKWIEKRKFSDEFHVNYEMLTLSTINHSRSHLFMACKNMVQNLFPTENNDIETRKEIEIMSQDPIWNHTPLPNDYDFYKTKKLIWHSIRLLYFGTDIKRYGKLINYTSANYLYEDVLFMKSHRWMDFSNRYMSIDTELTNKFIEL